MGRLNRTMQMIAIMQEFGWTYHEYMNTPNFVIELILDKLKKDSKRAELNS